MFMFMVVIIIAMFMVVSVQVHVRQPVCLLLPGVRTTLCYCCAVAATVTCLQ